MQQVLSNNLNSLYLCK